MKTKWVPALVLGVSILCGASASADVLMFDVFDHPDGQIQQPLYSLRLDDLDGSSADYTFSSSFVIHTDSGRNESIAVPGDLSGELFDGWGSGKEGALERLQVSYDTVTGDVRIRGHLIGGEDTGTDWVTPAELYYVDFLYAGVNTREDPRSDFDLEGDADRPQGGLTADEGNVLDTGVLNLGTLTRVSDGMVYNLRDENMGMNKSFAFNNTEGHRLGGTPDIYQALHAAGELFAGYGWLTHSDDGTLPGDNTYITSSDWLFLARYNPEASIIPEPATFLLLGLGSLTLIRRRRG